jgi:hypothetical protein
MLFSDPFISRSAVVHEGPFEYSKQDDVLHVPQLNLFLYFRTQVELSKPLQDPEHYTDRGSHRTASNCLENPEIDVIVLFC